MQAIDQPYIDFSAPAFYEQKDDRELVAGTAKKKVRQRTATAQYVDAVTVYTFQENRIYNVATNPGYFTSIVFEPGERILSMALGDPDRADWIVEKTVMGSGGSVTAIVIVQPGQPGLRTNLLISSNRRAYQFDITSYAKRAMDMVKFSFPQRSVQIEYQEPVRQEPTSVGFSPASYNRNFAINAGGDKPKWVPQEVFEANGKTYIEFPKNLGQIGAPALFSIEKEGIVSALPFRVKDERFYEVDRQFTNAELRQNGDVVEISAKR